MSFLPHPPADQQRMLETIGVKHLIDLFDEIPSDCYLSELPNDPPLDPIALEAHMQACAADNQVLTCFAGAGTYDHFIPAAVWEIASRGEFLTAYTPYQAEVSQGTLQVMFEYQTMLCDLTDMDVSNASLYDGATALLEACLMAIRLQPKRHAKILVPETVAPFVRELLAARLSGQNIAVETLPFDPVTGTIGDAIDTAHTDAAALVIPQPNFFGALEAVDALTDWAHAEGMLAIAYVSPIALGILKAPGNWGETGADICSGSGQAFGSPMCAGGPHFGFLTTRQAFIRQLPGRIVGQTESVDGQTGYVLTLQAREQHIRRAKATSNICTNQGLMATAATIYLSLMGSDGMTTIARRNHAAARACFATLSERCNLQRVFSAPYFNEAVIRLNQDAAAVIDAGVKAGILMGVDLGRWYPTLKNCLLIAVTEKRMPVDIDRWCAAYEHVTGGASC